MASFILLYFTIEMVEVCSVPSLQPVTQIQRDKTKGATPSVRAGILSYITPGKVWERTPLMTMRSRALGTARLIKR
jgi:hypothetical protein